MASNDEVDDNKFADFVEAVALAAASKPVADDQFRWEWEDLAGPIAQEAVRLCNVAGQQDPDQPGKLRIDAGQTLKRGGLKPNPDAVIVIDYGVFTDLGSYGFFAEYNLADELLRYAEVGEQGWDVARQIDQLERTIAKLRAEADRKGWVLPEVPSHTNQSDLLEWKPRGDA